MKKWFVIIILLSMLAIAAGPAVAATKDTGNGLYSLSGRITAIDPVARTVTVWVKTGNVLVKPYAGFEIVLHTTIDTTYEVSNSPTSLTFEQLRVGYDISSIGYLMDGVWTATRITVT
jgi:hypothetical protein